MKVGNNQRHLRTDSNGALLIEFVVLIPSTLVMHTEHADPGANHLHGLSIFGSRKDKVNHTLGKMALSSKGLGKMVEFHLSRELATVKEKHDFLKGAVLNEVFDVVTEVAKNPLLSLNITQTRFIGDDSRESFGVFRFLRHGFLTLWN